MSEIYKTRESGIELLRILAALGVVFSHFCNEGGISSMLPMGGGNYLLLSFIRSFTIASVDVFVLISGYFMCTSNKRTIGKPLSLLIQIVFFSLVLYLVQLFLGVQSFSLKPFVRLLIPANWFISLYIVLYCLSPYLNTIFTRFDNKSWQWFLGWLLVLFSLFPMFLGIAESIGLSLGGLSTIGTSGNNAGYTIVNFIMLYCIGAYLRINDICRKVRSKNAWVCIVLCSFLLYILRMIPMKVQPWHIAGWYDNILVILLAVSLLIVFKNLTFKNKIVNLFAGAAFTCYIIHYTFINAVDTVAVLQMPIYKTLSYIALFLICVYLISFALFYVYKVSIAKLVNKLDKFEIKYFE